MKKLFAVLALGALALGLFSGCAARGGGEAVSVEAVSLITGVGGAYAADSYAGKVVSGETAELKKDADKTVLEVFVEEGDMVEAGDVLFSYDMEAMQLSLDKLRLERESYENTIAATKNEISELKKQRSSASSSQQLSYTLQIDAREADIREAEYNIALKDKEIETMEASMENTEIVSPIAGRVMSVGSADEPGDSYGGDYGYGGYGGGDGTSDAFVTVMDVSAYRVEGRINELNRGALAEGMRVIVRSRADDRTWTGTIDTIDWEKPVSNSNGNAYYYSDSGGDEMTSSSQYPFYVVLDSTDGLLLGEHVYIEQDLGGGDGSALLLPSWYIVDGAYVWAADARGKLEKRAVELGDYDPDADTYEILSGLDFSDYIAFPAEGLSAGAAVVYYDESSFGGEDFGYEDYGYEDYGYEDYGYEEDYAFEEYYGGEDGFASGELYAEEEDAASDEPYAGEDASGESEVIEDDGAEGGGIVVPDGKVVG